MELRYMLIKFPNLLKFDYLGLHADSKSNMKWHLIVRMQGRSFRVKML